MRRVLFLCTGNFYRSRFAEALFNHHAPAAAPGWTAFSRGLALSPAQAGLSPLAAAALARRSIAGHHTGPDCAPLDRADLEAAERVIALCEREHRPLLARLHPEWEGRVEFWQVEDVRVTEPETALAQIEAQVRGLLASLPASAAAPAGDPAPGPQGEGAGCEDEDPDG